LFPKILLIGCIQLETFIFLITAAANLEQVSGCTVLKTLHQASLQILSSAIFLNLICYSVHCVHAQK